MCATVRLFEADAAGSCAGLRPRLRRDNDMPAQLPTPRPLSSPPAGETVILGVSAVMERSWQFTPESPDVNL